MLVINDVPIQCIHQAESLYAIPAKLIISVLKTEGGYIGAKIKNSNGSYDYGPMQINSLWIPVIKKYGYTKTDIQFNPCINVKIGAWILNQKMADETRFWQGVGDYHSHTPNLNLTYSKKVYGHYEDISRVLEGEEFSNMK